MKITNIRLNAKLERVEIIVDYDDIRHHAVEIEAPYGPLQVSNCLERLAGFAISDPKLKEATK